jgi:hypothetical protein
MDDLQTVLTNLEDNRLDYVRARSLVNSDAEGYRNAGIAKALFYRWPAEEREKLNELAQQLKRATVARAIMVIQEAAEEAARVKVAGLKSRDERLKQHAATEILDRNMGKPKQGIDLTSKDEKIQIVAYDYSNAITALAPRPMGDSDTPGEIQDAGDGSAVGQDHDSG